MLVNANAILNYNRCRRFAALNDPFTSLYLNAGLGEENSLFRDIILSHLYHPEKEIRKKINLTYEFEHEITLSENYDFIVDDNKVYCLFSNTSSDFKDLQYKDSLHKNQVFRKNEEGIYYYKHKKTNKSLEEKLEKLLSPYESTGKLIFNYALKLYLLNKVYPEKKYQLFFVLLNSDYVYDGISYSNQLYDIFDFSGLNELSEMVEIALFRMINHIELNDFTPCRLVKKACAKNKNGECKFTSFCYSHLPKDTSILDYFNTQYGFIEPSENGNIHHDTYDLLNEGYVSMQDLPISWLKDQNHLMQRYCVDNQRLYFHNDKIRAGLKQLKFPIYYLDFEAMPLAIPRFTGESPYSQSVFQYSVHIEEEENELTSIDKNHYSFIANSKKDEREKLLINLLSILNKTDSTIVVYNKTFEKTRLEEFKKIFPKYQKEIDKVIDRLFDLLDIVKLNKNFYQSLRFKSEDLESYNLYASELGGSYSLKKVIELFAPKVYDSLIINDGVKAYRAYEKTINSSLAEAKIIRENLFLYCRQDTYSMYQIIQGLKTLIGPEFTIKNS